MGLFLLAVLSGCISGQTPAPVSGRAEIPDPATIKAEREAATKAFVLCLMLNARDLDDRRSEPGSIATGVMSACAAEFNANVDIHSRYLEEGLEGRQKVATAARESGHGTATQFVLQHRNGTLKVPK